MFSKLTQVAQDVIGEGTEQLRSAQVTPPPAASPLRQFLHGFALPFVVRARALKVPAVRRSYWRITLTQAAVTVGLSLLFAATSDKVRFDTSDELREEAKELRAKAERARSADAPALDEDVLRDALAEEDEEEEAQPATASRPRIRVQWDDEAPAAATDESTDESQAPASDSAPVAAANQAPPAPSTAAKPEDVPGAEELSPELRARIQRLEQKRAEGKGDFAEGEEALAIAVQALKEASTARQQGARGGTRVDPDWLGKRYEKRAAELEKEADQQDARGPWTWFDRGLLFWAVLASTLYVTQFVVIALSRDHHDWISREASLAVGIEPEDPPITPRVHFSWKWLRTRMRRRFRGFVAISVGLPVVYGVAWLLPGGKLTESALSSLWFTYWWVVFSTAKSARAWTETPAPPWYLRGWNSLVARLSFLGRGVPRAYGRLLHHFTRELHAPATALEKQPYAMAGLGLARAIGSIPVVKVFMRPFFPVASAVLIEARRAREHSPGDIVPAQPLPEAAIREGSAWHGP